jgi:hypothetical protein
MDSIGRKYKIWGSIYENTQKKTVPQDSLNILHIQLYLFYWKFIAAN